MSYVKIVRGKAASCLARCILTCLTVRHASVWRGIQQDFERANDWRFSGEIKDASQFLIRFVRCAFRPCFYEFKRQHETTREQLEASSHSLYISLYFIHGLLLIKHRAKESFRVLYICMFYYLYSLSSSLNSLEWELYLYTLYTR